MGITEDILVPTVTASGIYSTIGVTTAPSKSNPIFAAST
jgi:hypothetical protein